ncbi:MAG: hypothetical protein AAGA01_16105, partial [Cyanobacteria bacterium P01_E01_bin.43]
GVEGWVNRQLARLNGTHPAFGTPPEKGFEAQSAGKSVTYSYPELRLPTVRRSWVQKICLIVS